MWATRAGLAARQGGWIPRSPTSRASTAISKKTAFILSGLALMTGSGLTLYGKDLKEIVLLQLEEPKKTPDPESPFTPKRNTLLAITSTEPPKSVDSEKWNLSPLLISSVTGISCIILGAPILVSAIPLGLSCHFCTYDWIKRKVFQIPKQEHLSESNDPKRET